MLDFDALFQENHDAYVQAQGLVQIRFRRGIINAEERDKKSDELAEMYEKNRARLLELKDSLNQFRESYKL